MDISFRRKTHLINNINSNKTTIMGVCNGHYNLYVRFCERLGISPIPQDKCTIELVKATHLVLNSQYFVNKQQNNNETD